MHRAQRLHRLEILDQHLLASHAQTGHRESQCERGQQALGNIRHNDAQHEDNVDPERAATDHTVGKEQKPHRYCDHSQNPHHPYGLALQRTTLTRHIA